MVGPSVAQAAFAADAYNVFQNFIRFKRKTLFSPAPHFAQIRRSPRRDRSKSNLSELCGLRRTTRGQIQLCQLLHRRKYNF